MRFLANENLPGRAVSALIEAGHDVVWVRTAAPGSTDEEILAWAVREQRVLLGGERRRDGAYVWGVFEDAAEEGHIVETFLVESWIEHMRQHDRVTNADAVVQEALLRYQAGGTGPKVSHFIAVKPKT